MKFPLLPRVINPYELISTWTWYCPGHQRINLMSRSKVFQHYSRINNWLCSYGVINPEALPWANAEIRGPIRGQRSETWSQSQSGITRGDRRHWNTETDKICSRTWKGSPRSLEQPSSQEPKKMGSPGEPMGTGAGLEAKGDHSKDWPDQVFLFTRLWMKSLRNRNYSQHNFWKHVCVYV